MTTQRLLDLILIPIKKNLNLFSFIYLGAIALSIVSLIIFGSSAFKSLILSLFVFIDAYIFCTISTLGRRITRGVIYAITGFLMFVEYFMIISYHTCLTPQTLILLSQTNGTESSEFLSLCLSNVKTWWSLALFIIVTLFSAFFIPLLIKRVGTKCYKFISKSKKYMVICISLFGLILSGSCFVRALELEAIGQIVYSRIMGTNVLPRYRSNHSSSWHRALFSFAILSKQTDDTHTLVESTRNASIESCSFTSPNILLIIGESFNKHHSPLYDEKSLETTPRLCERAKQGNIITYSDVVSPYNLTANVFVQLFSMSNCENIDNWCDYPLYTALFKKAGYEVTFISNQFPRKAAGGMWDVVGGSIFNLSGLDSLQFDQRNNNVFGHDINILKEHQNLSTNTNKPKLTIMHLYGQHTPYSKRHPKEYTPISKDDIVVDYNSSEKAKDIEWHYANATHYNDFVVDSILKLFDDTETVGIYLSDHGEEVYDFRNFYFRSHEAPSYYNIAKYVYEVPFMFYATEKYQAAHPEIMQQILASKDKPFMTDDLPQVMLYLAGIKSKDYDERRNILSPNFDTKRKRLLNDKYDYDALRAKALEQ